MGWHLEVFKLALYVTFPVSLFYVFNQPELFEDFVIKKKRELYPPQKIGDADDEIKQYIKEVKIHQEAEYIRQLQREELERQQSQSQQKNRA